MHKFYTVLSSLHTDSDTMVRYSVSVGPAWKQQCHLPIQCLQRIPQLCSLNSHLVCPKAEISVSSFARCSKWQCRMPSLIRISDEQMLSGMSMLGHTYGGKLQVAYLIFKFKWACCILSGNSTCRIKARNSFLLFFKIISNWRIIALHTMLCWFLLYNHVNQPYVYIQRNHF